MIQQQCHNHGPVVAVYVTPETFNAIKRQVPVLEMSGVQMLGVAVYCNGYVPDDLYLERYADGFLRSVRIKPKQECVPKKKRQHQRPLRNMKKPTHKETR